MTDNQMRPARSIVTIYDDIYDLPDCRAYYRAMDHAGFRTAHHAGAAFNAVLAELKRLRGPSGAAIVDFASGYGIAAGLMRHEISLDDVLTRYRDGWFDDATPEEVIAADRDWYTGRRRNTGDTFFGVDIAANALAYARQVGILDQTFAEDLQQADPGDGLAGVLAGCDLIVECGSIAHMLPEALDRMLTAARGRRPWVATAPIRGNDTAEAIEVMRRHGLVPEVMDMPPFRHRRFDGPEEQARAIANAEARGHPTKGYESTGYFHAQIVLARPKEDVTPLASWPISPVAAA